MKCATCGYNESLPFKKISLLVNPPVTSLEVFACPRCGTLRINEPKQTATTNEFNGCKCPYCGNTHEDEFAIRSRIDNIAMNDIRTYNVMCSCGACGPDADSEQEAIEKYWREGRVK